MLEGINVTQEKIIEVALARASILQRENIMMEAALNEAHAELALLRTLIPSEEDVKEDGDALQPSNG